MRIAYIMPRHSPGFDGHMFMALRFVVATLHALFPNNTATIVSTYIVLARHIPQ
jgi:hypothetical protein